MIFNHVRLTISCLQQLLRFVIVTQAPPWVFAGLLIAEGTDELWVDFVRRLCEFCFKLMTSHKPQDQVLLEKMPFLKWLVVQEPLRLFEAAKFDVNHPCFKASYRNRVCAPFSELSLRGRGDGLLESYFAIDSNHPDPYALDCLSGKGQGASTPGQGCIQKGQRRLLYR